MGTSNEKVFVGIGFVAAFILWYFVFATSFLGGFWTRITLASLALALYALIFDKGEIFSSLSINATLILKGIISGSILYVAFFLGFNIFEPLLGEGARNVYVLGAEAQQYVIIPILLLTSFCEEYFWRRYLQGTLVKCYGKSGLLLSAMGYAIIHVPTMNLPLIIAALIAGIYWGQVYEQTGSFNIILWSHIVWTELIFVFLPLN